MACLSLFLMCTASRPAVIPMPHVSPGEMSGDGGCHLPLCPSRSSPARRLPQELLRS